MVNFFLKSLPVCPGALVNRTPSPLWCVHARAWRRLLFGQENKKGLGRTGFPCTQSRGDLEGSSRSLQDKPLDLFLRGTQARVSTHGKRLSKVQD